MVEGYFGDGNLAFVSGSISFPDLQHEVPTQQIRFLVDTGCTASMVQPKDVKDLGVAPHLGRFMPVDTTYLGAGGFIQGSKYALDAVVILDGTPEDLCLQFGEKPLGKLDVKPPAGHPGELEVPSLLGWDVLQHLLVAFDRPAGTFRLYTTEEAQSLEPIRH